jgi:hypothetical protein
MTHDDVLADFFATDVQDYRPRIDEISKALAAKSHAVFVGNGFELMLSETQAVIRQTHGRHNPMTYAVADFAAAFARWVDGLPRA